MLVIVGPTGKDRPETVASIMLGDPQSEARAEAIYHMRLTLGKLMPFMRS